MRQHAILVDRNGLMIDFYNIELAPPKEIPEGADWVTVNMVKACQIGAGRAKWTGENWIDIQPDEPLPGTEQQDEVYDSGPSLEQQIADLQMAVVEIYEEVLGNG